MSPWLNKLGFKRNPFTERDTRHDPYLEEYFVHPEGFENLFENKTSIVYGSLGGGKTACCRMIDNLCKLGDYTENKVFTIIYDDFQGVVENARGKIDSINASNHVKAILKKAVHLLSDLKSDNVQVLCPDYSSRLNSLISHLQNTAVDPPAANLTPTELLQNLFDLLQCHGFDVFFILIDNIDGLPETHRSPESCFKLLKHIIATETLMNLRGVYFKFFLPSDIRQLIENESFNVISITKPLIVTWPREKLFLVLKERLISATNDGGQPITSLAGLQISENTNIDEELVSHSKTPGDLIHKCNILFSKEFLWISRKTLEKVLRPPRRIAIIKPIGRFISAFIALFFFIISVYLFLPSIYQSRTNEELIGASIVLFARYSHHICMTCESEINITVKNISAEEIKNIYITLIFKENDIEIPKNSSDKIDSLLNGAARTISISFKPGKADQVNFNIHILANNNINDDVIGGTIDVVRIPKILGEYLFINPLLTLLGLIGVWWPKKISIFISKILGKN